VAVEACALLAMAALRSHDRVGAVLFTDRVELLVPPSRGRRHVLRVLRELLAFEPAHPGTDLAAALGYVIRVFRRRAVLFVVSDFLAAGWERALEAAARRHEVVALLVADPRERDLPDAGLVALRDPETGAARVVDTSDPAVRRAFHDEAVAAEARLARMLARHGADLIRLETGRPTVTPLLAFFRARGRAVRPRVRPA
jgi:uncharacterized protein (DUF58 family)